MKFRTRKEIALDSIAMISKFSWLFMFHVDYWIQAVWARNVVLALLWFWEMFLDWNFVMLEKISIRFFIDISENTQTLNQKIDAINFLLDY